MKAVTPLEFEKPVIELEKMLADLLGHSDRHDLNLNEEISSLKTKIAKTRKKIYEHLTPWQRVQIARHPNRPYTLDYLERIATSFNELHGDRSFRDDRAIVAGIAEIEGIAVMIIGLQKGRNTKENILRNFGCAHPEGYRKALRLMRLADKFNLPIVCLIDTPGAFPGVASEERHVAEAIAVNIREMFRFAVPMISVIIGEGGSGGALGVGISDRVLIMENAYYSVISPEGCASILWKDRANAPKAAEALKISADDLLKLKLVDKIIPEPQGGAQYNWDQAAEALKTELVAQLKELMALSGKELLEKRYERYRHFGEFTE